jgi:hypothetical protein
MAHYFRPRGKGEAKSACGRMVARVAVLREEGKAYRCKSCALTVKARGL